jgi:hypothetical protein
MSDVKSFLDELRELNDKELIDVFVPSINKTVPFKPLSVKQQRDVIKTLLGSVESSISISTVFNNIIKENTTQKIDFKYYDRNKILLDIRRQSVGDNITIEKEVYNLNTLPTYSFKPKETATFEYNGITVKVGIPTLEEDTKITDKSITEISKLTADDKKTGHSISLLLVYELMKFVQTIQIDNNIIVLSELGTFDRKNIIENIPLKLNNIILDFISTYKESEQELFTFNNGTKLNIDASFITGE